MQLRNAVSRVLPPPAKPAAPVGRSEEHACIAAAMLGLAEANAAAVAAPA